jgi:predicted ATP-grasp superfamily ATP-dependent carboligase
MLARAAADAGYRPHVIDLFGDTDTRSAAAVVHVVADSPGLRLDPDGVAAMVAEICSKCGQMPLVWGSGLELQPHLLCALERRVTVVGCQAEALFEIVDPYAFGRALDTLGIPHPEVRYRNSMGPGRWLVKTVGGCGGAHVRDAMSDSYHGQRRYLQEFKAGTSMSVAFIADQDGIRVLGVVDHLNLQPDPTVPFRYGGAVACPRLESSVASRVGDYARRLSAHFQLRGLCGIDFVMAPDGSTSVLELNPRPTATFGLLTPAHEAFAAHMAACLHGRRLYSTIAGNAAGHAVIYACRDVYVSSDVQWPSWVADRPGSGTFIQAGEPLCSISAAADTPAAARRLLEQRFAVVQRQIQAELTVNSANDANMEA